MLQVNAHFPKVPVESTCKVTNTQVCSVSICAQWRYWSVRAPVLQNKSVYLFTFMWYWYWIDAQINKYDQKEQTMMDVLWTVLICNTTRSVSIIFLSLISVQIAASPPKKSLIKLQKLTPFKYNFLFDYNLHKQHCLQVLLLRHIRNLQSVLHVKKTNNQSKIGEQWSI